MADSRSLALKLFLSTMEKQVLIKQTDDAFANNLVLTTFRHLPYLKRIIKQFAAKSKNKPMVEAVLWLGAAELLYMESPDYAVINSYVELVKKKVNRFAGGFVNAILRNIAKNKQDIQQADKGEFFSPDFRKMLLNSYETEQVDLIEKSLSKEPDLDITVKKKSAICDLGKILPLGTLRLQTKGKIDNLPDYEKGVWWVQDFSSALPVKMLGDVNGKKVLDVCAAPGGKTAQLLASGAKVTAVDVAEDRLQRLRQNLQRLNLTAEDVICSDALDYFAHTDTKYDVVLLDAPCSASGTLRRHPEAANFKTINDVIKQAKLQEELLAEASKAVIKGGILLYCTCSLCKEEGEWQIEQFVKKHPNYKIVDLHNKIPECLQKIVDNQGCVRVLPHYLEEYGGADGFFVACLRCEQ